jgi:hypothetical protein
MKIVLIYVLSIALAFALFFSCQRELSPYPEPVSTGILSKDNNNNCEPVIVKGIYNKDQDLIDSNYLEAVVNITSPGSYNITTDTVNGYFFRASGLFSKNGSALIKLQASGRPAIADTDHFTIKYNESTCEAFLIVTDTTLKPTLFSLEGAPGVCMNNTVYGSYVKGVVLDTNAKIKISVDVTTPGIYAITTNTTNGYGFSGSGTFSTTGVQPVFLTASGTPLNDETDVFDINTGTSSCSFSINVLTAITVTGNDYYPLSANSYWTYDDLINIGDTIKETIVDSTNINNDLYKVMQEDLHFGGPYQYFYRKSVSDYFEYAAPNKYTTFFQYKKPVYADIPFLEENLATGTAWQSPDYIDTSSNGDVIWLKYNFTCLDANATMTLNGKAFTNVYKIKMLPLVKMAGGIYAYTNEEYLFCYAKGIGLIYLKKTLSGFTQKEIQIRNWQVN